MNNIKLCFFVSLIVLIGFNSCKSLELSDMKPKGKNQHILPNLEPKVDIFSFKNAFPSTVTYFPATIETKTLVDSNSSRTTSSYTEPSVNNQINKSFFQTISFFEQDVKNNICNPIGTKKGFISCKIVAYNNTTKDDFLRIPSILSFYIANYLGMPYFYKKVELELEVEILDLNKNIIARYLGEGKACFPVAFYYGYSLGNVDEKANLYAFRMAMNEIKTEIDKNYNNILSKLQEEK